MIEECSRDLCLHRMHHHRRILVERVARAPSGVLAIPPLVLVRVLQMYQLPSKRGLPRASPDAPAGDGGCRQRERIVRRAIKSSGGGDARWCRDRSQNLHAALVACHPDPVVTSMAAVSVRSPERPTWAIELFLRASTMPRRRKFSFRLYLVIAQRVG